MKKFLSLALALIMVMSLFTVGAGAAFTDAEEIKQEEAVALLSGLGVIGGYPDGSFKPGNPITRGATTKILTKIMAGTTKTDALEKLGVEEKPFSDVELDNTYAAFIQYCKTNGVVAGYPNGEFKPFENLKGYHFLKMVLVALGVKDIDWTAKGWEIEALEKAEKMDLLEGIPANVVYSDFLSRENACQIAMNALTYTPDGDVYYPVYVGDTVKKCETEEEQLTWYLLLKAEGATIGEPIKNTANSLGAKNWGLESGTRKDAAGLTLKTWTNGKTGKDLVEYAAIAPELKLTYTTGVEKEADIAKALGYAKDKYADAKFNYTVNGIYTVDGDVTLTGAGVETKVYATGEKNTYTVIVVAKTVETVKSVTKADAEKKIKASIELSGGKTFETTGFKQDQIVLVTYGLDKDGKQVVVNVEKPATINGKVTATAGDKSYIKLNGEDTKYAIAANNIDKVTVGTTARYSYDKDLTSTYYLDTYGNIIAATKVDETKEEVAAKYIYVYDSAVSVKADTTNLFDTVKGSAAAQVKVVDLATGELSVKDVALVAKSGSWYLADAEGEKTGDALATGKLPFFGTYKYTEVDGKIVLGDKAETTEVTLKKDTADLKAAGLTATSATTYTTVEIVYEIKNDVKTDKVVGATVKTVTGIAKFPSTEKKVAGIVTANDKNIVSNILVVTEAAMPEETVNYAIYKGAGEVGAAGSKYAFYVDGEVVEYASTVTQNLKAGDVVTLNLKDGKIKETLTAVAADKVGKVTFLDATFMIIELANKTTEVIYFKDTVVVDEAEKFAAAELAEKDEVSVFLKSGKAAFIVIAK